MSNNLISTAAFTSLPTSAFSPSWSFFPLCHTGTTWAFTHHSLSYSCGGEKKKRRRKRRKMKSWADRGRNRADEFRWTWLCSHGTNDIFSSVYPIPFFWIFPIHRSSSFPFCFSFSHLSLLTFSKLSWHFLTSCPSFVFSHPFLPSPVSQSLLFTSFSYCCRVWGSGLSH